MTIDQLQNWIPHKVHRHDGHLHVEWCHLGGRRFVEPFFQDTIDGCLSLPANMPPRPTTPIEVLGELHGQQPGLAPSGFIFHMSRCGSTLASRMLAALPQNVVLSEAEPIDAIIGCHDVSHEQRIEWLRWMVSALGQCRHPEERHLFLKMDCWHSWQLPLIIEAFPDVPWVFLYRDPVEVMVSHRRHPGRQMLPGGSVRPPGMEPIEACLMPPEEYCARVLAAICQAALDAYDPARCRFIDYRQLPAAALEMLPQHFGLDLSDAEKAAMRQVATRDAKRPVQQFQDDSDEKQSEATEAQRQLAELWVGPHYKRLQNLTTALI